MSLSLHPLMSEIKFALSSSGLMYNEGSSTLPKQDKDGEIEGGLFVICPERYLI
jgi:hypothetical protein